MVYPDSTQRHPLLDKPSLGIGGIEWSQSGWLGVNLANGNTNDYIIEKQVDDHEQ
jgi:hypothetical protein